MNVFELQAKIGLNVDEYMNGIKNAIAEGKKLADAINTVSREIGKEQSAVDASAKSTEKASDGMSGLENAASDAAKVIDKLADEVNTAATSADKAESEIDDLADATRSAENDTHDYTEQLEKLVNAAEDISGKLDKAEDKTKKSGDEAEKAGKKFETFKEGLGKAADGLKKVADVAGQAIIAITKIGTAAVGAATTGLVALTKQGLDAYGMYEQLAGGAQKIFDTMDFAAIERDAANAYKDLNMSANQYLEAINLAGATFAQTMGDKKGYETARTGMLAIADYASGTGRSIDELNQKYQLITRAASSYQSIADQFSGILPATSVDFLAQAQAAGFLANSYKKLTDVPIAEYQEAVTKMLENGVDALGLSNNTARESAETITGSMAMVQAAWENLLIGFGREDADLADLSERLMTSVDAVASNIAPRIGQIFDGISRTLPVLIPKMYETAKKLISENSDGFVSGIVAILKSGGTVIGNVLDEIISALPKELPALMDTIGETISTGLENATSALPKIGDKAGKIIGLLADGLIRELPAVLDALNGFGAQLIDQLPKLFDGDKLRSIVKGMVNGLLGEFEVLAKSIPTITAMVTETIGAFVDGISGLFDSNVGVKLIDAVVQSIIDIALAITDNLPKVLTVVMGAIPKVVDALLDHIDDIINAGTQIIQALIDGFISEDGSLIDAAVDVIMSLVDALTENIDDILLAGQTLITTLLTELTKPETLEKVISAGTTILAKLVEGVFKIGGSFLGFTEELGTEIGSGIAEYDWEALGYSIITGIADGLLQIDAISEAVDGLSECWAIGYIDIENFVNDADEKFADFADSFSVGMDDISTKATDFLTGLGEAWSTGWNDIKAFGEKIYTGFTDFGIKWGEFWVSVATTLQTKIDDFKGKLQAIPDKFTELVEDAKTWGRDMIQNFVDGITAKWHVLTSKVSGAAGLIADYLHFSVPKKGPLSDFDKSAPDMMELFAKGIRDNESLIADQFGKSLSLLEVPHLDTDLFNDTFDKIKSAFDIPNIDTDLFTSQFDKALPFLDMPEFEMEMLGDPLDKSLSLPEIPDMSTDMAASRRPTDTKTDVEPEEKSDIVSAILAILAEILGAVRAGRIVTIDDEGYRTINEGLGRIQRLEERGVLV